MKSLLLMKTSLPLSKKRTRNPRPPLILFVTAARAMTTKKVHAHRLALATKETGALLEQRQDQASDTTRRVAWTCSIKPQLSFRHAFNCRPRHATCVARLRRATRFPSWAPYNMNVASLVSYKSDAPTQYAMHHGRRKQRSHRIHTDSESNAIPPSHALLWVGS